MYNLNSDCYWRYIWYNLNMGRRVIGISGSLIWWKTLMELIFNPCSKFWWSLEDPVSQIRCPHIGAPVIFLDLLRSVQMLKREWGAESNGKLPHLFVPSKTAALGPEFALKDLPLRRIHDDAIMLGLRAIFRNSLYLLSTGVQYTILHTCI